LFHVQVTLANGTVLVAGGESGLSSGTPLNSTEIYNPSSDNWSGAPDMGVPRVGPAAVLLSSGKVLVAGGSSDGTTSGGLATAEVYDPTSNTWTPTANNMSSVRGTFPTAALLANGQVLVAGGQDASGTATATADLYNPATNSFSPAHAMAVARAGAAAASLPGGKLLVAGGEDTSSTPIANAEVYDPGSNTWTATANQMSTAHLLGFAATLPGGKVLITAGENTSSTVTGNTELYDPTANTFSSGPNLSTPRVLFGGAALRDGRVLVTGGANISSGGAALIGSTEIYTPATNTWSTVGSLGTPRAVFGISTLTNGRVLATGGATDLTAGSGSSSAELFTPATIPGAPQAVSATAGNGSATVTWAPPASDGGSPIAGYTVKSSTGQTVTTPDARTAATVTGLHNGSRVTFTVTATNAFGTGAASAASNGVIPGAPVLAFKKLPKKLKFKAFLKGLKFTVTPNQASSLQVSLLGTVKKATISRANLTLASKKLGLSTAARKIKLVPKRKLVGTPRKATVQLVIVARNAAGISSTTTRKIKLSR
jgi:N-acetylneuraminic acid mutarotase